MNRSCSAKEKTRHAATDLSPLEMVLGRPLLSQRREHALRRAGLLRPSPWHNEDIH